MCLSTSLCISRFLFCFCLLIPKSIIPYTMSLLLIHFVFGKGQHFLLAKSQSSPVLGMSSDHGDWFRHQ